MGTFDVSCGISNVNISEDDSIGFVILGQGNPGSRANYENQGTSIHTYPDDLYKPFLPPVFGVYDGYGNIVNITPSTTTEVLEQMFEKPVEDVLNCIHRNSGLYDKKRGLFKMYGDGNAKLEDKYNIQGYSDSEILTSLGFTHRDDYRMPTYFFHDYEFISPKQDYWIVNRPVTSATLLEKQYDAPEVAHIDDSVLVQLLNDFAVKEGVFPGYPKKDWKRVGILASLSGMFLLEEIYNVMEAESHREDDFYSSFGVTKFDHQVLAEKYWKDYLDTLINDPTNTIALQGHPGTSKIAKLTSLPEDYYPYIKEYIHNMDEFESLGRMMSVMRMSNRSYHPSVYINNQNDNLKTMLVLLKASKVALKKKIQERKDEYDG